jgi:hypothetical protein
LNTETDNLWKTYDAIQELIRFADTKATAILAISGVIAGFYFSNFTAIQNIMQQKSMSIIPLAIATILLLFTSALSAYCIAPRLKMNKSKCLIFFCDIANYKSADEYGKALSNKMTEEQIKKQLIDQVWANSKIATKKYRAVNTAVLLFVASIVSSILFIFLGSTG